MQVHFGTELLHPEWDASVACIGTFDGVHLGHRTVISTAVAQARSKELPAALVTFDRHPAAVLAPDRCPLAIASVAANLDQFEVLGVAIALVLPFTCELSQTTASDFLEHVLQDKLHTSSIVVGHDFAFGKGREGDAAWLSSRIPTTVIPPFELDDGRVSSSAIRAAIQEGRVEDASRWLGRPFTIEGIVIGGQKLGRKLGYPTANLARSFHQCTPADGIYGGIAITPSGRYKAAISIGVRPAVGGGPRWIEAHLLDYPGNSLYGHAMRLEVHCRLRPEQAFESLEQLAQQIEKDVARVKECIRL